MSKATPRTGISLTQDTQDELLLVEGYGGGGFRLKGRKFDGGLWINGESIQPHSITDVRSLTIDDFADVIASEPKPEIILVGTGEKMALLPAAVRNAGPEKGVVFEMMDTGAAARTYNILIMEGRQVACYLLAID